MDKRRWDIVIPIITIVLLAIVIAIGLIRDAREKLNEVPKDEPQVETRTDADVATATEPTPEEVKVEPKPTKEVVHYISTETTTQATTTEEVSTEVFSATITTEEYTEAVTEDWTEEVTTEELTEEYYEEPSEPLPPEEPQEPEEPAEPTAPEGMTYLGSYWITGYTATGSACANGNYPSSGYTAACNSLPMGTVVYIEGIGTRVIEDRGGMSSNVIDVFVDSTSDAYAITGTYDVYIVE